MNPVYDVTHVPLTRTLCSADFNCRGIIDRTECHELAKDIDKNGLMSPITVRPLTHPLYDFQVVAGHRRYTAYLLLNKETIPAFVDPTLVDDSKAKEFCMRENIHRSDLNITQEAEAVSYFRKEGYSLQQIADRLGKSMTWVEIRRKLVNLPDFVQKAAADEIVNQSHINQLWEYRNDPLKMSQIIQRIKERVAAGEKVIVLTEPLSISDLAKTRRPKPGEIKDFMYELARMITNKLDQPEYFAHRALAWTYGEISLIEAYKSLEAECNRLGLPFTPRAEVAAVFDRYKK